MLAHSTGTLSSSARMQPSSSLSSSRVISALRTANDVSRQRGYAHFVLRRVTLTEQRKREGAKHAPGRRQIRVRQKPACGPSDREPDPSADGKLAPTLQRL